MRRLAAAPPGTEIEPNDPSVVGKDVSMSKKALLVYPEMPPTYWSFRYTLPFIGKQATLPPLGLLTVASLLPDDWDLTLVDMNVEALQESAVAAADLVLLSSMLVQKDSMERVVQMCRRHGRRVVAGGPYPTSCHASIQGVDHFVLNEAEMTLPGFLEDLEQGTAAAVYSDETRPGLAHSPPPRFDLLHLDRYSSMAIQYSRGCPHSCEFCDIVELFGHRPRTKTTAQVLGELDALLALGWRGSIFVVDDNFIGNTRQVKAMLPHLAAWQRKKGYPFTFFTEATLSLAGDTHLMDLMVEAGFNMVFVGIETPDVGTLAATGKSHNLRFDMVEGIRRIQAHGMEVAGGFILGFDTDQPDIFDRQITFIQEAAIPTAMVGLLTALPRTRLYRRLAAEGRITEDSGGNNTHDLRLNFVPKMNPEALLAGYQRVLAEIYKPEKYFDRCLKLLASLKVHRASTRRIKATELRALLRSLLVQTFTGYSWAYWRFLVRGALARPRLFAETVTMAVKGHHFFTMTRNLLEVESFRSTLHQLTQSFEERIAAISAQDLAHRMGDVLAYRDRLLRRMDRRYRRLHRDFRRFADDAVEAFQVSMDELLARLQADTPAGSPA